jgi:hypothetical protein
MKKSVTITLISILINAIIWLLFSIVVAAGLHPALPDSVIYQWIMAGLSLLASGFLFIMFFLLRKKIRAAFFLTIAFLVFLAVLTIADDLGLIDLIVLLITLTPIVLLIRDRKNFLSPKESL